MIFIYIYELKKILNVNFNIDDNIKINKIKFNSKEIEINDLFIALKGKKYNGNDYIYEVLNKGGYAITSSNIKQKNVINVEDTYDAMKKIANYNRNKYNAKVIAITGSNGKTTTKELISYILSINYKVLYNKDNNNNIIGICKTLLSLNSSYDIVVLELGSNHIGEIEELSKVCNPDIGIITNIGSSHLEYFKNKKNIFKEKFSIIKGMKNLNLIVNGDDKYLKKTKSFKCGVKKNNNLRAYNIKNNSFNIYLDKEYKFFYNLEGIHFINDILLSIAVACIFNISINGIIKRVNSFKQVNKRMEKIQVGSTIIINDCYNSSYESFVSGICYLKNIKCKKYLIVGDILELGKYSKKIHKKLNRNLKMLRNKEVITVGENTKYINSTHFNSNVDLIKYLKNISFNNSYIYIKGSRRTNLDEIYTFLLKQFDK